MGYIYAQNGLENITVEKYYVSNAADSIGSFGNLPVGSVTYRLFVDMLPGYKFQAVYGVPEHTLLLTTSTAFFNNEDRGKIAPTYTLVQAAKNTVMLDSWISVGGACTGKLGILKSEDDVAGGGATVVNTTVPPILQNNDPAAGIPLTVQDGLYTGTVQTVTTVNIDIELEVLNATSQLGDTFMTSNGSWASLNGSIGPIPSTNRVLIAQLTTNGVFHYELNVQIKSDLGVVENYVVSNPTGNEIIIPSLTGTFGSTNTPPTVSITSPSDGANYITGAIIPIAANATDDGTVASVEFFVDGVSIGIDNSSPYNANYTSIAGSHTLTAKATDNNGAFTISSAITINVSNNPLPIVNITSPSNGAGFITGSIIPITANASDNGSIASVEFFVDGVSIGIDNSSPYSANYTSMLGSHNLTAKATDNNGAFTISSAITINVSNNPLPIVNITSPSNGAGFITGSIIPITANASDNGSVTSVEFFVDGVSIGIDNSSPYSANYTSMLGSHNLTATATDNLGAQSTSSIITISVGNNPPPTINITSPSNGDLYIAPAVVTINANANDPNGTVSQVQFYVNGVLVGSDASAPYSFNWTGVIGQANITAKATDNLGAQTTSAGVLISVADPNIPYKIISSNNKCLLNSFCLPVSTIDTVDNIIGYDLVLHYNKIKTKPTGLITLGNALINPSFVDVASSIDSINGLMNISLYFNTSAPSNAKFHGIGNIFCVEFTRTPNFNPIDTAIFTIPSINESYVVGVSTKLVDAGKYISYKDSTFNGSLRFWLNNIPVKYNAASPGSFLITNIYGNNSICTNKSAIAVQPDTTGNFHYSILNGQNINIEKDISGIISVQPVVNGFDALQTRKILINDPSFTPSIYQMIAMDVNTDGKISAGDVSQINQRAVLIIPEFKQAWNYDSTGFSNGKLSKDWLFIDSTRIASNTAYKKSLTFPNDDGVGYSKNRVPVVPFCLPLTIANLATCPQISSETYKGVLLGDVDGNYSTVSPNGLFRQSTEDKIIFDISKAVLVDGFTDIPVFVQSVNPVYSLDFSLKFDQRKLTFNSVVDYINESQSSYNLNASDKTLRFTSNSFLNFNSENVLVSIRFANDSNQINANDLNSVEGYLNGNSVKVEVINSLLNSINSINDISINIFPNPVSGLLNVIISENSFVQLMDLEGKIIINQAKVNAGQKTEINTQNISNGIYLMKVFNNEHVFIKKIIVNN